MNKVHRSLWDIRSGGLFYRLYGGAKLTGAKFLVVTTQVAPLTITITNLSQLLGQLEGRYSRFSIVQVMPDRRDQVVHEFLYVCECPVPVLGRDLLTKLGAQISFSQKEPKLQVRTETFLLSVTIPSED